MNLSVVDIVVIVLILLLLFLCFRNLFGKKKKTKSSYGCDHDCANCVLSDCDQEIRK
jgi:hypothetical protein